MCSCVFFSRGAAAQRVCRAGGTRLRCLDDERVRECARVCVARYSAGLTLWRGQGADKAVSLWVWGLTVFKGTLKLCVISVVRRLNSS
jgi:hypothetical protein